MLARTLIDHFVVKAEEGRASLIIDLLLGTTENSSLRPDKKLQASATAILTCCRPFLNSELTPRIIAAEADNKKFRGGVIAPPLRSLLYTADTAQFSQALFIHNSLTIEEIKSLLSNSQYGSRSLLRLRSENCNPKIWNFIIYEAKCVNLEEIHTDENNIFQIFYKGAIKENPNNQNRVFKIPLKKLTLEPGGSIPGLLATGSFTPAKLFSQQEGTGWGNTLRTLHLKNSNISDEEFEAFQFCYNLREIETINLE